MLFLESVVPNNNVQLLILFQLDKLKLNNILAESNVYKDTRYRKNEYNFITKNCGCLYYRITDLVLTFVTTLKSTSPNMTSLTDPLESSTFKIPLLSTPNVRA